MQLKYNRQQSIGSSITRILIKLVVLCLLIIAAIFLIEKIKFPSPEESLKIDITNEIKKLK
jgi:flagellar biogenesis protein FliO|tara:strand:- start:94 stop:276 length:183 start_codon:yes stop_codon:yes gene_type:complete